MAKNFKRSSIFFKVKSTYNIKREQDRINTSRLTVFNTAIYIMPVAKLEKWKFAIVTSDYSIDPPEL